jgi:hypothetical protein
LEVLNWPRGVKSRTHLCRRANRRLVDDPNVTDEKFPGKPPLSRSGDPLRVIGQVLNRQGHTAARIRQMMDNVRAGYPNVRAQLLQLLGLGAG